MCYSRYTTYTKNLKKIKRMKIERFRRYINHYCRPEAAALVGWDVIGMRSFLMTVASASTESEMTLKAGEDGARRLLGLTEEQWMGVKSKVLEGWLVNPATSALHCHLPVDGGLYKKTASKKKKTDASGNRGLWGAGDGSDDPAMMVDGRLYSPPEPVLSAAEVMERDERKDVLKARFDRFWAIYPGPRRMHASRAFSTFERMAPDESLFDRILSDIALRTFTRNWNVNFGQYVPLPQTYLNSSLWDQGVVLTDHELVASTMTAKKRYEFHAKTPQETQSWVTSQSLAGKVPTQDELCARLGVKNFSPDMVAYVAGVEVVSSDSGLIAPAPDVEPVVDSFYGDLKEAIAGFTKAKQAKILEKTLPEQREWLRLWRAANAGIKSPKTPEAVPLLQGEEVSRARETVDVEVLDVTGRVVEVGEPRHGDISFSSQEDWF